MKKKHTLFELHKGKDGQWYARIKAKNGQTLMSSEGYKARRSALRCLLAIVKLVQDANRDDFQICEN